MSRTSRPAMPRPSALADQLDDIDDKISQVLTSAAATGITKPTGVPNSVFDAGKLAKPPRKPQVLIDLATVKIDADVPLEVYRPRDTTRVYDQLLASMQPGNSVLLTRNQAKQLVSAGAKRGVKVTSRVLGPDQARVWRLAGPAKPNKPTTGDTA